ncbi:MAG: MFS transporter [Vulcanimicrobiaceae bacterium]|jgi:MFS family permease
MARESIFSSRDFRLFYFGQATSYVGDGLRAIAIPLLVFKLTGSALNLGLTFALEVFTFGVFSLLGGSLADRLNRKRLMIVCDIMRFAIILSFALGFRFGWLTLPFLYGGIVLHSMCGAVFNGGQASSIPYVLGKDRATRGVAALSSTESAVNTVAPPIGGAIFGFAGPFPALLINAFTYIASIGSLSAVRDLGPELELGFPRPIHIVEDIATGFRFLFADRTMRTITMTSFLANTFGVLGFTAYVPYIKRDLGGNDLAVGIVFGVCGLGAVLGALIVSRIRVPYGKIIIATYLWTNFELPVIWTHQIAVAAAALGLASIAGGASVTATIGWRMRIIPEETVGRVFGAVRLLVLAGMLPGALIGGALADAYGARFALTVSVTAILLISLWVAAVPTIRKETR